MKKLIIIVTVLFFCYPAFSDDLTPQQHDNLVKYWKYRDRFRKHFIVISPNVEEPGVNIPAVDIYRVDDNRDSSWIDWSDGNSNMSHYLSILATELWLLKNNKQDYTETLTELYYAMSALERLDLYSDSKWRARSGMGWTNPLSSDINGFHMRDDVNIDFWNTYKYSKWKNNPGFYRVDTFSSRYSNSGLPMEEMSQDCIIHIMEGLGLVSSFVGVESVAGIPINYSTGPGAGLTTQYLEAKGIRSPNGQIIDFSKWAKDFIGRYLDYMQNDDDYNFSWGLGFFDTNWILRNPGNNGNLVQEGSGNEGDLAHFYSNGLILAGGALTGVNHRQYPSSSGDQVFVDLFQKHAVHNNVGLLGGYFGAIGGIFAPGYYDIFDGYYYVDFNKDDSKIRTLGALANINDNSYESLQQHQLDNDYYPYEHLTMLYLAIFDKEYQRMDIGDQFYQDDSHFIRSLLISAPECGPASHRDYNFSSSSRCVWPENLGTRSGEKIEYAGMDYMMLHNLFYVVFRKEDLMVRYPIIDDYTNETHDDFRGILEATNTISGGHTTYTASNEVRLKPGFNVSVNGDYTFNAKIGYRDNDYPAVNYKVLPETFVYCNDGNRIAQNSNIENTNEGEKTESTHNITKDIKIVPSPNPNSGRFSIKSNLSERNIKFEIISVSGVILQSGMLDLSSGTIDISSYTPGIYYVKLITNDKVYTMGVVLNPTY